MFRLTLALDTEGVGTFVNRFNAVRVRCVIAGRRLQFNPKNLVIAII